MVPRVHLQMGRMIYHRPPNHDIDLFNGDPRMGGGGGDGQVRGATQSVIEINTYPHKYKQVCLRGLGMGGVGVENGWGWRRRTSQGSDAECH